MFNKFCLFSILFILLVNTDAWSLSGPELPVCPQCEIIQSKALPKNTVWWNPEQSGVGINIEVQGERVFGIYYGYDDSGQSTWYTFVGDLLESTDPQSAWTVDAPLLSFQNGKCINCDHQTPELADFSANIHLEFNQANHASYRIDEGEMQNIVPFIYGVKATTDFPEQTLLEIPSVSGNWVFAFVNLPVFEHNPIESGVLQLSERLVREFDDGTIGFDAFGHATDVLFTVLSCRTYHDSDQNIAGPICVLFGSINDDGTSDDGYILNIGDIGTNKMIGRKANGDTIEAYKLEFTPQNN